MNFFTENQKKRQTILLAILAISALIGFGFLYRIYFPAVSFESADAGRLSNISETAVHKAEKDVRALKEELANGFYGTLKKYNWTPDMTAPGKVNPFVQ